MNYALVFRVEVSEELNEAYTWYESQQLGLGDDFLDCIDEILKRICLMPEAYAVVYRDVRRAVVRRFPYAVYYRIGSSRYCLHRSCGIALWAVPLGRQDAYPTRM